MARASTIGENACLSGGLAAVATWLGMNTTDPGTSSSSGEVSGGSYARQAITWGAASGGSIANSGALVVPIPASTTVAYFSTWNTSTVSGGTGYEVGGALSSSQTFSTAGTFTIASAGLTISIS